MTATRNVANLTPTPLSCVAFTLHGSPRFSIEPCIKRTLTLNARAFSSFKSKGANHDVAPPSVHRCWNRKQWNAIRGIRVRNTRRIVGGNLRVGEEARGLIGRYSVLRRSISQRENSLSLSFSLDFIDSFGLFVCKAGNNTRIFVKHIISFEGRDYPKFEIDDKNAHVERKEESSVRGL